MELTAHLVWYLAWNALRTVILENHHLTDSKNALLVLMTSLPSNLEQTKLPSVEKNANQASTQKLVWHPVHLVP